MLPHPISRRTFLTAGAMTAAQLGVASSAWAAATRISRRHARGTHANTWLADPPHLDHLRALALVAMDAARVAGADFADIRIGVQRRVRTDPYPGRLVTGMTVGYGVRAWHNGTWSFQHGNVLTSEAVAATATSAVSGARIYAAVNEHLDARRRGVRPITNEWAPAPVVTGEWHVPVAIDPFTVPFDDLQEAVDGLRDITAPAAAWEAGEARSAASRLEWHAETRVFASTQGSLVTQNLMHGALGFIAVAQLRPWSSANVTLTAPQLDDFSAGFEALAHPDFVARLRHLRDTARRWEELPVRPFNDVGRFPIVFDGQTTAAIVGGTIDMALDGDRIAGIEADASGTSFLTPIDTVLGAAEPQCSPLLSARVDRALPSRVAVQWDDDGVVPEAYTVLDHGHVVDMHTTRETAPLLADWYRQHGRLVRSHGCAVAPAPDQVPRCNGGHLTVAPSTASMTLDAMIREIPHGFLVINGAVDVSPGLSRGTVRHADDGVVIEIHRGVPVSRTPLRMQFLTQQLLNKNLSAIGDATTMRTGEVLSLKGIPWTGAFQMATTPAALCRDVDVIA